MNTKRLFQKGYTLIEVLAASTILSIAVGAAASLSLTMNTQEEINHRVTRALSIQENATIMFQLGLDQAQINNLIPQDPQVIYPIPFNVTTYSDALVGYQQAECPMQFKTTVGTVASGDKKWTGGAQASEQIRTNTVWVLRAAIN